MNDYVIVYDILRDGIGIAPIGVCLGMLAGFGFGIGLLISERKQRKPVGFLIVWLILWTAGTIVGLEDRIAYVDAQLSYAAARGLAPPYRKALWGERVELMNALVQVRFAQTQGF